MHIINKDGTENEVVKAYDELTEEYGYCILCDCCDEPVAFLPECIFLDMMNDGEFEVFVDEVEEDISDDECDCPYCQGLETDFEDDEDLCQCEYCCGFRDGIKRACDVRDALEEYDECDCECGECCSECSPEDFKIDLDEEIENDLKDELLALKEEMSELLELGYYSEYAMLVNCYEKLYNLIY